MVAAASARRPIRKVVGWAELFTNKLTFTIAHILALDLVGDDLSARILFGRRCPVYRLQPKLPEAHSQVEEQLRFDQEQLDSELVITAFVSEQRFRCQFMRG